MIIIPQGFVDGWQHDKILSRTRLYNAVQAATYPPYTQVILPTEVAKDESLLLEDNPQALSQIEGRLQALQQSCFSGSDTPEMVYIDGVMYP